MTSAEKYYRHVLWCPGGVFNSTTPRFAPAQAADGEEALPEVGAAQPAVGAQDAAAGPCAAAAAAAGTSAPRPSTFHDPGGHGPHRIFPPVYYEYPSLCTAFSQCISDLVGRSRKEDALTILKEFDKSTKRA
jgi:hypothetical protein